MALRLVDVLVPETDLADASPEDGVRHLAEEHGALDAWTESGPPDRRRIRFLVDVERVEALLEDLQQRHGESEGFRAMLLPVEASVPMPPEDEEAEEGGDDEEEEEVTRGRVSREELHARLSDISELDTVYLVLTALSALVCAFGLLADQLAVVIGAMVIAPLLGPVIAVGLATTLADLSLALRSGGTALAGLVAALLVSLAVGAIVPVDPSIPELAVRTDVGLVDLGLSLAAGAAGTLAFTAGTAEAVIGVMVAVALVPPLVTGGLLLGAGRFGLAMAAFLLTAANLVGMSLTSVLTFLLQGVRPSRWWEAERARRATRIALLVWTLLTVALGLLIWLQA